MGVASVGASFTHLCSVRSSDVVGESTNRRGRSRSHNHNHARRHDAQHNYRKASETNHDGHHKNLNHQQ